MKKNERKELRWKKSGLRPFWTADLKNPVKFLSKDFLEGKLDNGYPYAYPYSEDAPNEGISIPTSIKGKIAGKVTGSIIKRSGVSCYPILMPFIFYNSDGTSYGNFSQLLRVFVKVSDVA